MDTIKASTPSQSHSIRQRLDQFYQVFFIANIFFMTALDLQEFVPYSIKPGFVGAFRAWYIRNHNDQFFVNTPQWLHAYFLLELFYSLPMNLWAVWALGKRHRLVPLQLLIFAAMNSVTTVTCVADITGWTAVTAEEKTQLMWMYGGYLVPLGIMGFDMFMRIREKLLT